MLVKQQSGSADRVRIKGHAASVFRFFFIAIAFMELWILVTSQLTYYSRLYGAQILLQLNLAFYVPSIPVLVLSGQVEKVLDDRFGKTMSMMIRLNTGLAGCLIMCAAFPFLPTTHFTLITAIAILGTLSAVAFSTTYQLVQWFRSADTIGLGIGCVGSGPLVLFLQICLEMGSNPERWQLITIYEISALLILVGLCSSLSLFYQYWDILSGNKVEEILGEVKEEQEEVDISLKKPLLEVDLTVEADAKALSSQRLLLTSDPFMAGPLSPAPPIGGASLDPDWDAVPVLQKTTSPSLSRSRSARLRGLVSSKPDPSPRRSLRRLGSGSVGIPTALLEPSHQSYAAEQML
eukprot:CAMPEP_0175045602 /NCGR_PEP_ID=MMETSP0052_2-20121109/4523_1 /TAXON_ID=51329 ORGANISM="Polytomella parva, Strain SAG 63-3" /NCGR_SAMPLE_ID=MMETSP0052_2 /ASSEMBLY_ACC=CAM_ASM_000194 /LENGTH=348 /DNA_ID=CAMNT_0016309169 /DNA_START=80 /DNA_END=1123 /DNA_ORIENTATION=-